MWTYVTQNGRERAGNPRSAQGRNEELAADVVDDRGDEADVVDVVAAWPPAAAAVGVPGAALTSG
jgi:hypothetical protein